jgi:hypothetical protein
VTDGVSMQGAEIGWHPAGFRAHMLSSSNGNHPMHS